MTAAIIGLIGAVFGAVIALVGSALSDRRQTRQEDIRWRRDQRVAAYEGALRHLLRAANLRSKVEIRHGAITGVLDEEGRRDWFADLVEAQFWLHTLISRCEPAQSVRLGDSVSKLDNAISSMDGRDSLAKYGADVMKALDDAIAAVSKCAQLYMSIEAANGSNSRTVFGPAKASP